MYNNRFHFIFSCNNNRIVVFFVSLILTVLRVFASHNQGQSKNDSRSDYLFILVIIRLPLRMQQWCQLNQYKQSWITSSQFINISFPHCHQGRYKLWFLFIWFTQCWQGYYLHSEIPCLHCTFFSLKQLEAYLVEKQFIVIFFTLTLYKFYRLFVEVLKKL